MLDRDAVWIRGTVLAESDRKANISPDTVKPPPLGELCGMPSTTATSVPRRFDFIRARSRASDRLKEMEVRMLPDPRRYDEVLVDGQTLYRDKYLNELTSLKEMAQSFQAPVPIYHLSPSLGSTSDYATERRAALRDEMSGGPYIVPSQPARPHQSFSVNATQRNIAFLSVDVSGSTALRNADGQAFDRSFAILLRELGTIVGQFNGTILKTKGDGFVAYIDHPSFTSQCDATIDLGLSLLVIMRDSVNPELKTAALPVLNIRVGADFGAAAVVSLAVPATGFTSTDIASDALNRAVKIEESCAPNEFRIGRRLYELIHVQWLERALEVSFDGAAVGMLGYQTYRVT